MATANWPDNRETALERDDYECAFCGMTNEEHRADHGGRGLEVHHVIPRRHGGENEVDNLLTLCRGCHQTLQHTHSKAVGQMYEQNSPQISAEIDAILDGIERVDEHRNETLKHAKEFSRTPEIEGFSVPKWRLDRLNNWEYVLYNVGAVEGLNVAARELERAVEVDSGVEVAKPGSGRDISELQPDL